MSDRRKRLLESFLIAIQPGVRAWLLENISIPKSMAPARVRGAKAPLDLSGQGFAKYILETVRPDSGITDVAVCGAAQVFKTFGMSLMIGYRIVHAPMPMLIVFPSKEMGQKQMSRTKLQPLINCNPVLAALKPANNDDFTDMQMLMLGGAIRLTGANSPANLASTSEGLIWQDECCKFEHHQSEESPESHPMRLADERSSDFGSSAFRYKSSSPNHVLHPFWTEYEAGTQTHFLVTCPNCAHLFPFEDWPDSYHDHTHIGYEKCGPDYKALRWSPLAKDAKGQWDESKVRETIRYHCPACDYGINEHERRLMLDTVEEHHINQTAAGTRRSYRLPKFYSPSQTMGSIAWNRIKPGDLFTNIQHHANSWLALPWQDIRSNIKLDDIHRVRDAGNYQRRALRSKPLGLFMGADVGDHRQHWVVGAVFDNDEIDVIDWGTCTSIDDLLIIRKNLSYRITGTEEKLAPSRGLIDSKDRTIEVFSMCRRSEGFWYPSRGTDTAFGTWGVALADRQRPDLFSFNTFQFKKSLYVHHLKERCAPLFSIPRDADEEFMHGLTGQQLVVTGNRERFKPVAHDHYGDCCIRILLARLLMRANRGETAPDMPSAE